MARRSRKRSSRMRRAKRDLSPIARPALRLPSPRVIVVHRVRRPAALPDLRRWTPSGITPVVNPSRDNQVAMRGPMHREVPTFVDGRSMICARRKERREVLFAKRRTSSGAGRRKRRNRFSDVRC